MIFTETKLKGAYIIEPEKLEDERGFFARTFCQDEFRKHGLNPCIAQCNISYNKKKGTLRGMHYQAKPYEEAKLVSCIKGSIYDVIIDLREDSETYCQWFAVQLSSPNSHLSSLISQLSSLHPHLPSLHPHLSSLHPHLSILISHKASIYTTFPGF
jgi:dTDP-4-dehydrorhamnose 3,5-epimerase